MTINEAKIELEIAGKLNEGKWISHSINVANAARLITLETNEFDPDFAYICGLLHDIGRRFGFSHIKHTLDGYEYLEFKHKNIAKLCLTHSFPNKNILEYQGIFDITIEQKEKIESLLKNSEYDYYDEVIQICDSYGSAEGYTKMEERWVDVSIRNGINDFIIEKWKKIYEIKNRIEIRYNINIEELLGLRNCPTIASTG